MQQSLSFRLNKVFHPLQQSVFPFSILSFGLFGFVAMGKALWSKTFGKETQEKWKVISDQLIFFPVFPPIQKSVYMHSCNWNLWLFYLNIADVFKHNKIQQDFHFCSIEKV